MAPQVHGDESMEEKSRARPVPGQALVAEGGRNAPGAQQRGQEVAFRVAKAHPVLEHLGGGAGNGRHPAVRTVLNGVADPQKTAPGDFLIVGGIACDVGGGRQDGRVPAVDGSGGLEKLFQRTPMLRHQATGASEVVVFAGMTRLLSSDGRGCPPVAPGPIGRMVRAPVMKRTRIFSVLCLTAGLTFSSVKAEDLKVGDVTFAMPANWSKAESPNRMAQAAAKLAAKDGAAELICLFFHFGPGQGGDVESNIPRWKGYFEGEAKMEREEVTVGAKKAPVVNLTGTFIGSSFNRQPPKADQTMVAVVVPSAGGDVFLRLVGPSKDVAAAKEDIRKLIQSAASK